MMEDTDKIVQDKKLYEASLTGNVERLDELMQKDELTLARVCVTCFNDTPLHIAAMLGHLDFAKAVLNHKADLSAELNSQAQSPLHLASANGYVEIVKVLISANPDSYLIRDKDGRTPLHVAVMKGRLDVVEELVRARPEVVQYRTDRSETLLHLAVKHNRIESLKLLVELNREDDLINVQNADGNTILHTAAFLKQTQTVKYLLTRTGVSVNAVNENGFTALDIIEQMPGDFKTMEIRECLLNARALRNRKIPESVYRNQHAAELDEITHATASSQSLAQSLDLSTSRKAAQTSLKSTLKRKKLKEHKDWLEKTRDTLMVAASLIAAMSYQAGLSPPGGVWDHDSNEDDLVSFSAGTSILATKNNEQYSRFWLYNTISLVASLSTMFLLVSGLPLHRRFFLYILMAGMWVTITSMAFAYLVSMGALLPDQQSSDVISVLLIALYVWMGMILIALLVHVTRLIIIIIRKLRKCQKKKLPTNLKEQKDGDVDEDQDCV